MKKSLLGIFLISASLLLLRSDITPQQKYIDTYSALAVEEMYRSGVPASITLAQGLLESRYGLAELASKGNNHFGIKCHDWKGKTMKVDDDKKGECFRVYDDAADSFRDHSDFLRYRDRYKSLFDNQITDYKSWAVGLKKAGYATDPQYAQKLIRMIEDYDLAKYDTMKPDEVPPAPEYGSAPDGASSKVKNETKHAGTAKKQKPRRQKEVREYIPESPNNLERDVRVPEKDLEEFRFSMSRKIYSRNNVPFVYAMEGDTYSSIAESNNMLPAEVLRYNDLKVTRPLLPGDVVYLRTKKNYSKEGLDKYIVGEDGESLWAICQRFAVRQKIIMKLNGFAEGHVLREGDTILLRK